MIFKDMKLNGVHGIVMRLMVEGLLFYCNAKFEVFHLNHRYLCSGTVARSKSSQVKPKSSQVKVKDRDTLHTAPTMNN